MSGATKSLQAEIAGTERAIRHLIGERRAVNSQLARTEARLTLERSRLAALLPHRTPSLPVASRFPDVSSYQPNVDWKAVHAGSAVRVGDFAFTKITEGESWTDRLGATRWREMAAVKMRRGAYHFAHPSGDPIAQAQHFLTQLHQDGVVVRDTDILCLDLEVSDGAPGAQVARFAKAWAGQVRKNAPSKLWLYGGGPFLRDNSVTLDGYDGHWLAAYVSNPTQYMVFGRSRTVAWQYTDGVYGPTPHACPGIGGCDLSIVL